MSEMGWVCVERGWGLPELLTGGEKALILRLIYWAGSCCPEPPRLERGIGALLRRSPPVLKGLVWYLTRLRVTCFNSDSRDRGPDCNGQRRAFITATTRFKLPLGAGSHQAQGPKHQRCRSHHNPH